MDRRGFLAGTLALGAPGLVRAQSARRVIVVGAGSAGITAAKVLAEAGAEVTVLEASGQWGGRVKRLSGFADFPIDLGAEWIHSEPEVLDRVVGRRVQDEIATIPYQPQTYQIWKNGSIRDRNALRFTYEETKFYRTTWYGVFERFMVPDIADRIVLNAPVSAIDHSGGEVAVRAAGRTYRADAVVVTVPLGVLQSGAIAFTPAIPPAQQRGMDGFTFGSGMKAFLKFRERFYPDMLIPGTLGAFLSDSWSSKLYYDAAFGKGAADHVLGLFWVDEVAVQWERLSTAEIIARALGELDTMYDGAASRLFVEGRVQNWTAERHIGGSYSMEYDYEEFDAIAEIFAPLGGRVFFAGEALGGESQSTVHGASLSGRAVAEALL